MKQLQELRCQAGNRITLAYRYFEAELTASARLMRYRGDLLG